jgi:hypothetical protein
VRSDCADSALKTKARRVPGCGCCESTSIVAGWVGELCQVLEIYIASVYAGFGGFGWLRGLDKVCGGGWVVAVWRRAGQSPSTSLRAAAALRTSAKRWSLP